MTKKISLLSGYSLLMLFLTISCSKEDQSSVIPAGNQIEIIYDKFQGEELVIFISNAHELILAFKPETENRKVKSFIPVSNSLPVMVQDEKGNRYDVFGLVVEGPDKGDRLLPVKSYSGYWFAFASVFPNAEVYQGDLLDTVIPVLETEADWLIPGELIVQGGSSDGVPALTDPDFRYVTGSGLFEHDYLDPSEKIIGIKIGKEVKAYPVSVLNYHEIVNDKIGENHYVVSYCPLTATGIAWNNRSISERIEFYVSGLLFNSNLMPAERVTNSIWSQMKLLCVNGEQFGTELDQLQCIQTDLSTWMRMYPNTTVLSDDTGYDFNYTEFPYHDYLTEDYLMYPVRYLDDRLSPKELVHGVIINDQVKVYRYN